MFNYTIEIIQQKQTTTVESQLLLLMAMVGDLVYTLNNTKMKKKCFILILRIYEKLFHCVYQVISEGLLYIISVQVLLIMHFCAKSIPLVHHSFLAQQFRVYAFYIIYVPPIPPFHFTILLANTRNEDKQTRKNIYYLYHVTVLRRH